MAGDVDLLIIAGDVCPTGDHSLNYQERWCRAVLRPWLYSITCPVIGVGVNHDFVFQHRPWVAKSLPWIYLEDEMIITRGVEIYGTPWTPEFGRWAFVAPEAVLADILLEFARADVPEPLRTTD